MIKRKIPSLGLIIVLMLSVLAGCSQVSTVEETVELLQPVGVTANYVTATRRDLVASKTLLGKAVPIVSEISFSTDQRFSAYGVLPGSEVKKGEAIILADTESLDKQIDALNEKIKNARESYEESIKELKTQYSEAKTAYNYNNGVYNEAIRINQASSYEKYHIWALTNMATMQKIEQNIKRTTELYELDKEFNELSLKNLKEDRKRVLATASKEGVVVATQYFDNGQYINKDVPVAGVADLNDLIVKTELINNSDIKRAKEYYAIVNGERIEVTFKENPVKTGENTSLTGTTGLSTFYIDNSEGKVKAGDSVSVIVISDVRENAICIPTDSIDKNEDGYYVYVFDGTKNTMVPVKIGLKNGYYTEILSGLNEGDLVVSDFKVKEKSGTTTLQKGRVASEFRATGYIFYPKVESIKNPVEYGTTYIDELLVSRYEVVEKGQVLARVHVVSDDLSIKRLEREIQRAYEDLNELLKDEENYEKQIKLSRESIADREDTLKKMKSDGKITEIKAPYSGTITAISRPEAGDILNSSAYICSLAAEENCFIVVEDKSGLLTVGNTAKIEYYTGGSGNTAFVTGDVVTVSNVAVSSNLDTEYALIRLASEDFAAIASIVGNFDGWWSRAQYTVTADIRVCDNVVLVPKRAVTVSGDVYYVTVLNDKNEYELISFISGGSDSNNYFAVDGLSEGMTICLE